MMGKGEDHRQRKAARWFLPQKERFPSAPPEGYMSDHSQPGRSIGV